jgi:hypothetical protein
MDNIIKIGGLFCAFGIVILLGIEMRNIVKLPILALLMLFVGYCLIKKQPIETKSGKDRVK